LASWHILTPEFPPQTGGVGDYVFLLANGLAAAGDEVHVWGPSCPDAPQSSDGVVVHADCGRLAPGDLVRVGRLLDAFPTPRRVLVQWVPHGYGWRAMNLPFCLWLWGRSVRRRDEIDIMVHEPYLAFREGTWRRDAVAAVHRLMTVVLLASARRVWIAIPGWEDCWRPYALGRRLSFVWLPVPSALPPAEPGRARAARLRYAGPSGLLVGHFGTYGPPVRRLLDEVVPAVLDGRSRPSLLLLGARGDQFRQDLIGRRPDLAGRVHAPGRLPVDEVANHLAACDLAIQPYPDGISSRRTSAMASLAQGLPIVTTKGRLTEPLWNESGAVALADVGDRDGFASQVERLLGDPAARRQLGEGGRALYDSRFDLRHTIETLRASRAT
jgi:glycosyltransferase involved in cell wall biosynthesis